MSWLSHSVVEDDLVTVYWFPQEPDWSTGYVARALGLSYLSCKHVNVTGTPDEVADWTAAATAYVDEVAVAVAELSREEQRIRRWRKRPVVRWWAKAKYDEAKASFLGRVRPATSVYQPVRDAIEGRIAEQEALRLEAGKRAYQEQEARRLEAKARFQEWEWRQAAADRPLSGGLSPRQMAARGDNPTSWPPELQATVGDLVMWWAGVRASVRNEQAREEATRKVVEAITATAAALEEAGRPGISAVKERPYEVLHGWWIDFNWSDLPDTARLRTPPDVPKGYLHAGEWNYDLYLPGRMLFTPKPSGKYHLATVTSESIANGLATRYKWREQDIEQFAESLIPGRITYLTSHSLHIAVRLRITDYADPAVFVPYVDAVAQRAVAHFQALVPGQK